MDEISEGESVDKREGPRTEGEGRCSNMSSGKGGETQRRPRGSQRGRKETRIVCHP